MKFGIFGKFFALATLGVKGLGMRKLLGGVYCLGVLPNSSDQRPSLNFSDKKISSWKISVGNLGGASMGSRLSFRPVLVCLILE